MNIASKTLIVALISPLAACENLSDEQLKACRGYEKAKLVSAVASHLRQTDAHGEERNTDITSASIIVDEPPHFSTPPSPMWVLPFHVRGSSHFTALIGCRLDVELSVRPGHPLRGADDVVPR